jgi:ssDNA-binding Zn-finger/Zn-ribbon topoisomerase 1
MMKIKCPKCGSYNIRFQLETKTETKRRGCLGWLWWMFLALCTCGLILIIPLITNSKVKSKSKTVGICQDCGHRWYKIL